LPLKEVVYVIEEKPASEPKEDKRASLPPKEVVYINGERTYIQPRELTPAPVLVNETTHVVGVMSQTEVRYLNNLLNSAAEFWEGEGNFT
jgi:hypothetical protein